MLVLQHQRWSSSTARRSAPVSDELEPPELSVSYTSGVVVGCSLLLRLIDSVFENDMPPIDVGAEKPIPNSVTPATDNPRLPLSSVEAPSTAYRGDDRSDDGLDDNGEDYKKADPGEDENGDSHYYNRTLISKLRQVPLSLNLSELQDKSPDPGGEDHPQEQSEKAHAWRPEEDSGH